MFFSCVRSLYLFKLINSEKDTLKEFSSSYPDISGKLYKILLKDTNIDTSAKIKLTAEGGDNRITAFRYNSSGFEYISMGEKELIVPDIKDLKDHGWHIMVLVTNLRSESPYTEGTNIKLTIKVKKDPFKYCGFWIECWGNYKKQYPAYQDSIDYQESSVFSGGWAEGYFIDNTFYGEWDTTETSGWIDNGNMMIKFSENLDRIVSFTIYQKSGNDGSYESIYEESWVGMDVPQEPLSYLYYNYEVNGLTTCNSIVDVDATHTYDYIIYILESFSCNENSNISFHFYNNDDKKSQFLFRKK